VIIHLFTDLAFQIIHLYGDLVNSVNESGLTPLHLLANKPSVFKSGGRLGRFERIVYNGKILIPNFTLYIYSRTLLLLLLLLIIKMYV